VEDNDGVSQNYYGHSFIADHTGALIAEMDDTSEGVIVATFDLDDIARYRADWGFFRDRRTDLYGKAIA
jgi:N-carbamoylputrescine amidase